MGLPLTKRLPLSIYYQWLESRQLPSNCWWFARTRAQPPSQSLASCVWPKQVTKLCCLSHSNDPWAQAREATKVRVPELSGCEQLRTYSPDEVTRNPNRASTQYPERRWAPCNHQMSHGKNPSYGLRSWLCKRESL